MPGYLDRRPLAGPCLQARPTRSGRYSFTAPVRLDT